MCDVILTRKRRRRRRKQGPTDRPIASLWVGFPFLFFFSLRFVHAIRRMLVPVVNIFKEEEEEEENGEAMEKAYT